MSRMPWFKAFVEFIDDEKMIELSDAEFRIWWEMLALARSSKEPGVVLMPDERIAWRLRRTVESITAAITRFAQLEMVERVDGGVEIVHFRARQGIHPSDSNNARAQRKKRSRAKSRAVSRGGHDHRHEQVTSAEEEVEEEEEEEVPPVPPKGGGARKVGAGPLEAPVPDPQPPDERGIGTVSKAFEKHFGKLLAGTEYLDVRRWVGRGVLPERIVEAIEVACTASPPPKSRWRAAMALVRDTPPGEPMRWGDQAADGPAFTSTKYRKLESDTSPPEDPAEAEKAHARIREAIRAKGLAPGGSS